MSIKSFRKKWAGVMEHIGLVKTVEDASKMSDKDFDQAYRTALGKVQEQYGSQINGAAIQALPFGDRSALLTLMQRDSDRYLTETLKNSVKNVKDIISGLGDKLKSLALSLSPIKNYDATKQHDLENLVSSYRNRAELARRNLSGIDSDDPAYKEQEQLIKEQDERASLIDEYKGLIRSTMAFRSLQDNLTHKDGPDEAEMQDLCLRYLGGVVEGFGNDKKKLKDNIPLISDIHQLLSEDKKFLQQYYASKILVPASKKYEAEVAKHDLKDYVARNLGIMNTSEQAQFFGKVYSVSESAEAKKKLAGMYKDQFGLPEKSKLRMAA